MNRSRFLVSGALLALIALVSSCSMMGLGTRDELQASIAAGALLDYVAEQGLNQVQELETSGESYDLNVTGAPSQMVRAVTEHTRTIQYPNVTVTITREVDENDPATPTDDVVTVTRVEDYGFEANRVHVIERPRKPSTSSDWDSYEFDDVVLGWAEEPADEITQDGTIRNLLDDVEISSGEASATWKRSGDNVYAAEIVKEMSTVARPNVVHQTTITQTEDGETTLVRTRLVDGEPVHSYTVEEYVDPDTGDTLRKIVRDDGSYAIIRERGNRTGDPRVVEYYTSEGVLFMIAEEVVTFATGTVRSTRTFYDADGEVTGTRTVTYAINYMEGDEDSVQITRTVNGRQRIVTITESGDVYVVTIRNETYLIRIVDATTVEFLDDAGNVVMTALQLADGSWQITSGGDSVIV